MSDMNTGAAAPQDERERFEAWYTDFHKHAPLFKRDEEGTYLSPREDVAWKAWLGRTALPAQAVALTSANDAIQQAIATFDDVLSDIADWEDQALADRVREAQTGLRAALSAPVQDVAPSADLRYIQRVLESDAPREDRDRAAQMVRDMRRAAFASSPPAVAKDVAPSDALDTESVLIDGTAYDVPAAVACELLRLNMLIVSAAPQSGVQAAVVGWLRNERGDATGLATHDPLFLLGHAEPRSGYTATYSPVEFAAPAAPQAVPESFQAWSKTVGGDFARHNCGPYVTEAMTLAGLAWTPAQPAAQPADAQQWGNSPATDAINLLISYRKLCVEIRRGDSHHLGRIDRAVTALVNQASIAGTDRVWRDAVYQEARAVGTTIHMDSPARTLSEIMGRREQNAAQRANEPTPDDLDRLAQANEHFSDDADTTVECSALLRLAGLGLLDCVRFEVTDKGRAALAARTQEGAAALSVALAQLEEERARNAADQSAPKVAGYLSKTGHGTYFRETITPALAELEWCGTPMWRPVAFVDAAPHLAIIPGADPK